MDSRGWIPISLLASFNRVRQITNDERLVKEVFALSLVVETRDDHVRMGGDEWKRYVLPTASHSVVEPDGPPTLGVEQAHSEVVGDVVEAEEEEEEDDDDDEVEFVMEKETAGEAFVAS